MRLKWHVHLRTYHITWQHNKRTKDLINSSKEQLHELKTRLDRTDDQLEPLPLYNAAPLPQVDEPTEAALKSVGHMNTELPKECKLEDEVVKKKKKVCAMCTVALQHPDECERWSIRVQDICSGLEECKGKGTVKKGASQCQDFEYIDPSLTQRKRHKIENIRRKSGTDEA